MKSFTVERDPRDFVQRFHNVCGALAHSCALIIRDRGVFFLSREVCNKFKFSSNNSTN